MHDLPFDEIFAQPSLTSLRLHNCHIPTSNEEGSPKIRIPPHIKTLTISNYGGFPLSLILQTNIESLTVHDVLFVTPMSTDSRVPHACRRTPSKITKLCLRKLPNIDSKRLLVDAFTAQTRGCECRPLDYLQDLEMDLYTPSSTGCLRLLLPSLHSLQSLTISGHRFASTALLELEIRIHNRTTFNLKFLSISFYCRGRKYANFHKHLLSLLEAMAADNKLEELRLCFDCDEAPLYAGSTHDDDSAIGLPERDPWSLLDEVLAGHSAFPKLKTVDIRLHFSGLGSRVVEILKSRWDGRRGFKDFLKRSMPRLARVDRGVHFTTEVAICDERGTPFYR
ncbi:hypothetical protein BJ165DRAFT_1500863 [Panaeolus papilionaceus]|nr:hypothetical protein BJ165DRAFT_1500863 [Panaeolus papilionaceus]